MSNLKLVLMILVAILIMSCNSNEPEINDGIGGNSLKKTQNGIDDPKDAWKELDQAYLLYYAQKYDEFYVAIQQIIEKYKNENTGSFGSPLGAARQALLAFEHMYERAGRARELLPIFEEFQGDSRFETFARYRTGHIYNELRECNKAVEIWKGIKFCEEDAYFNQYRLLDLGIVYADFLGNNEEALKYFLELINTYPACDAAAIAECFYMGRFYR